MHEAPFSVRTLRHSLSQRGMGGPEGNKRLQGRMPLAGPGEGTLVRKFHTNSTRRSFAYKLGIRPKTTKNLGTIEVPRFFESQPLGLMVEISGIEPLTS